MATRTWLAMKHPQHPPALPTDQDYIPYNGPYEPPKLKSDVRLRKDSWGDPVQDIDFDADLLVDPELHSRYGVTEYTIGHDEHRVLPRARTQSGVSGRTVSSGTLDPANFSLRRSTVSAGTPPVPSYMNTAAGGVGESPIPLPRPTRDPPQPKRTSLAQIFNLNRKVPKYPTNNNLSLFTSKHTPSTGPSSPLSAGSSSGEWNRVTAANNNVRDSSGTEEDYYNSYYSTLTHSRLRNSHHQPDVFSNSPSSPSYHPYANPLSITEVPPTPQTAPIVSPSNQFSPGRLRKPASKPSLTALPDLARELKNSFSSPDLRDAARRSNPLRPLKKIKFKDRWLSTETWCDAILFPRPRFKVKGPASNSDRIVSPPGSPVFPDLQANAAPGVASRVLAHSRSLVDLHKPQSTIQERERALQLMPREPVNAPSASRPPRPRSFALDDLALPSPIPSLSQVLEEAQILDHQRKKWQMQAQNSFQNSRARSLSRSRTKSLTRKRPENTKLPPIDYLTARSLLGNQQLIPVADKPARLRKPSLSESKGTFSRGTHSHNNSLSKTISKSSKSHSRGHSRNDSLGKSALKMAKALCGVDDTKAISPADEKADGLEGALRNDKTKIIRLADPAHITVDSADISPTSSRNTVSPAPSGLSDSRVGIALSTPPPLAQETSDPIQMFSHPYAQGGLFTYNGQRDYAGPHPTTHLLSPDSARTDVQRHRLPPQASVHPYAQAHWRDSYQGIVPQLRPDSDVPPPAKMWAQFSPGGMVREVLPHELIYSPFISEHASTSSSPVGTQAMEDRVLDTIGVGEALYQAVARRRSKDGDSGLGTSEDHTITDDQGEEKYAASDSFRVARKPVQYDPPRPIHIQAAQKSSSLLPGKITSPTLDTIHSAETHLGAPSHSVLDLSPGHSASSSTPDSHDLLDASDDNERFRDLFYKPGGSALSPSSVAPPLTRNSFPWTMSSDSGSGLTGLARQLSQEFEEINAELGIADNRSRDSHLHFVLSDSTSLVDSIPAFKPSINIPEDVESSRASSVMERSPVEEPGAHMKYFGSVTTPPATSSEFRKSYTVQPEPSENEEETVVIRPHDSLAAATLSLPSSDPTRSSYMTSSSLSRMSGLSDFPVPPPHDLTPAHMSVLNAYFTETPAKEEVREFPATDKRDRRYTFGTHEDINELLTNLSSNHS